MTKEHKKALHENGRVAEICVKLQDLCTDLSIPDNWESLNEKQKQLYIDDRVFDLLMARGHKLVSITSSLTVDKSLAERYEGY